ASGDWAKHFVQSACDYDAVLGDRTFGLTLDDATRQLQALEQLSGRAEGTLPLHLTPQLFREDKTGLRVQRRIEAFFVDTESYHRLAPVVAQAIRNEDAVTQDRRDALRALERTATQLGIAFLTQAEMRDLCGRLLNECERLETALAEIYAFCGQNSIPLDG